MEIDVKSYLDEEEIKDIVKSEVQYVIQREVYEYFKGFDGRKNLLNLVVETYVKNLIEKYEIDESQFEQEIVNSISKAIQDLKTFDLYKSDVNTHYTIKGQDYVNIPIRPTQLYCKVESVVNENEKVNTLLKEKVDSICDDLVNNGNALEEVIYEVVGDYLYNKLSK